MTLLESCYLQAEKSLINYRRDCLTHYEGLGLECCQTLESNELILLALTFSQVKWYFYLK